MGWTGDTHVFSPRATYQSQIKNFYLRNLQAMKDLQEENGRLPNIAPFGGGFGGITYESAMILMCWELYQQYGDFSVVAYQRLLCKNAWVQHITYGSLVSSSPFSGELAVESPFTQKPQRVSERQKKSGGENSWPGHPCRPPCS